MKKNILMMATALSISLAAPASAFAQAAPEQIDRADVAEGEVVETPDAKQINLFEEEKKALLRTLHDAHMKLQMGAKGDAERGLNLAYEQLEALMRDGVEQETSAETRVTRLVEIKYGNALMPEVTYVPLAEETPDEDTFKDELDIRGIERGDVEDARIRYVRLAVNRDLMIHNLNEAREELTKDDLEGAQGQIRDAQKGMLHDFDGSTPKETIARDHIALTRFMLKAAEYEGAREALEVVESAMVDLRMDRDAAGRNSPEVEEINREMEWLSAMIERRDPSLADQIDERLEGVLETLG